MFIPLVGDLTPLWLEEISRAMTRRANLEMETARQMFLAVWEVMQRFATRGTVAQQSLIQRFYLSDEPPPSRNPSLEACFQALRAEPDFGARALAHYVQAEHEPPLPNLYGVSATIDRVVETVMARVAVLEDIVVGAEQETEPQGAEAEPMEEGEQGAETTREAVSREMRETDTGDKVESGGESRSYPSVAAASQPLTFEITTGTVETTSARPATDTEEHQAALNQLIRLLGPNRAVQILEHYVLAEEPITLDQARSQTGVEVLGPEQLQEAAQILLQEQQLLEEDVIDLASDDDSL